MTMTMRHNPTTWAWALAMVLGLALVSAVALPAQTGDEGGQAPGTQAGPESPFTPPANVAPMPDPTPFARAYPEQESSSEEFRTMVTHDPATGETGIYSPPTPSESLFSYPPREPVWPWSQEEGLVVPNQSREIEGLDWETAPAACTPPSANYYTHTFPWTATYKLLMRYNVGGTDYWWVCSGSPFGPFQILTAGHCIYSHDPNGDDPGATPAWANDVWVFGAQTDLVNPFDTGYTYPGPDYPYSFARHVRLVSYTGWTVNADLNHDMGYVTLDRRDPNHTGSMGREWGFAAGSLNFNGYPVETPYVPSRAVAQYPGFDAGNVNWYTDYRVNMCAYTYGGHSGGPVWRYDGVDRFIQGVNSTSNRVGNAEATRIAEHKFNDMAAIVADDEATRPPALRPDVAEYLFTTTDDRKDLLTNSVPQYGSFNVEYNALNAGFAGTGTLTFDFYLSTNDIISIYDTLVGTVTRGDLPAWTFTNPVVTLNADVPPGTYYVGWIMTTSTTEYGGEFTCDTSPCSNKVAITDETLTVLDCGDGWEPDNSSGQANTIFSGSPQVHSICPIGDQDWVKFTLAAPSAVTLETSGPTGDTRMWLYNSSLVEIEYDDNDGTGNFSLIDRQCGIDELAAGTYYVKVDEYGGNQVIDPYTLSFNANTCLPPALFCFSLVNFCDTIEILDVLADKTVVARWDASCDGSPEPAMGGYSGKNVSPRLSWISADPYATLSVFSMNLNVDNRTLDLFLHDTLGGLTQYVDNAPYTVTPGSCPLSPQRSGLPSSMDQ